MTTSYKLWVSSLLILFMYLLFSPKGGWNIASHRNTKPLLSFIQCRNRVGLEKSVVVSDVGTVPKIVDYTVPMVHGYRSFRWLLSWSPKTPLSSVVTSFIRGFVATMEMDRIPHHSLNGRPTCLFHRLPFTVYGQCSILLPRALSAYRIVPTFPISIPWWWYARVELISKHISFL